MTDSPSPTECGRYMANPMYIQHLLANLGRKEDKGQSLEWLAHYLVSMIPGCWAYRRKSTESSEHDVVGSFEGPGLDFRSEARKVFRLRVHGLA